MRGRWREGFAPGLRPLVDEAVDRHSGTAYVLDPDLRLAYVNPWWDRFARENGGEPRIGERWNLGVVVLDAMVPELRPFHESLLRRCLDRVPTPSQRPVGHDYECSSGSVFRRLHMDVHTLPAGAGLLVVNSTLVERPHDREARDPDLAAYLADDGMIRQCAHCRRTRSPCGGRWDWIPQWVERPPEVTSHTICMTCLEVYYP